MFPTMFSMPKLLKEPVRDFFTYKQSCTTFCMNLLLNSGAFGVTSNLFEEIIKMGQPFSKDLADGILEVPHFKTIIEKKFIFTSSCNIS